MLSLSRVAHALLHTAAPVFLASTVVTATSSIALAADNASASTPNIPHLERIDPLYRPYAAMMIGDYSNDEAVAKANPVIAGQTIDNIESFKRVFAENVQKAKETNKGSVIIPNVSLMFNFSSSSISSKSDELLKEYSKAYLQTNKEAIILVEGFTCNIGNNDVNNWISEQRAKNVQQALMLAGIPENKIEVKWYGKSRFNEFNYSSKSEYRRVILSIK